MSQVKFSAHLIFFIVCALCIASIFEYVYIHTYVCVSHLFNPPFNILIHTQKNYIIIKKNDGKN